MNERTPAVSVVISAKNAEATIGRTLDALAAQRVEEPYEVIVIDNGSTDRTAEIAQAAPGPVTVVSQEDTGGPGPARNNGVAMARAEIIAITDADCFPEPDWLQQGLWAMRDADLVQGRVVCDPDFDRGPWDRTIEVETMYGLFETANIFVRRDLFQRIGGFERCIEPILGHPFGEDTWFGWRAQRSGARLAFCRAAVVVHAVFRRNSLEFVRDKQFLTRMPAIVKLVPELRRTMLVWRWFLWGRSATFDLSVLAAAVAIARRSPMPLLVALPYAALVAEHVARWRHQGAAKVAAVNLAADAMSLIAMARGSLAERTIVL